MTIDDIKSIIKSDETRTLELKKTTGELKDGMHSACAFLNTNGGWLIIGVAPTSLKIVGQQVTDNTRREIAGALTSLEPAVDIRVEYIDVPAALPPIAGRCAIHDRQGTVGNAQSEPTHLAAVPQQGIDSLYILPGQGAL